MKIEFERWPLNYYYLDFFQVRPYPCFWVSTCSWCRRNILREEAFLQPWQTHRWNGEKILSSHVFLPIIKKYLIAFAFQFLVKKLLSSNANKARFPSFLPHVSSLSHSEHFLSGGPVGFSIPGLVTGAETLRNPGASAGQRGIDGIFFLLSLQYSTVLSYGCYLDRSSMRLYIRAAQSTHKLFLSAYIQYSGCFEPMQLLKLQWIKKIAATATMQTSSASLKYFT